MPTAQVEERAIETILCKGRLDAAAAPRVRGEVDSFLKDGRTRIIFDMQEVTFVDSSGLAVFVNALKGARAAGGEIAILGPTAPVRSILELTRLHRIMSIVESEEAAIKAVNG